jgi:peptidoglycan/xylan/chitin deacetylase (PgdA/CDA1 family)
VLDIAAKLGLTGALWTIDTLPAEDTGSPDAVVSLVLKKAVPGAIVLMHNGTYASMKAIPTLVTALRARGYRLVTLLQIAKDTPGAG